MNNKSVDILLKIVSGFCIFTIFVALGLLLVLNLRPLYIFHIDYFSLEKVSGLSKTEILLNYDWLISWIKPWNTAEFALPSIAASSDGIFHFIEVKEIIGWVLKAGLGAGLILFAIFISNRQGMLRLVAVGGIVSMLTALSLGLLMYLAPHDVFILFHEIVFDNDKWRFNPLTDPIINILPEGYFMQSAGIIALTVLIGSAALVIPYIIRKTRS